MKESCKFCEGTGTYLVDDGDRGVDYEICEQCDGRGYENYGHDYLCPSNVQNMLAATDCVFCELIAKVRIDCRL